MLTVASSSERESFRALDRSCADEVCYSYLDSKDKNLLEYKLDTFSSVYRNLTGTSSHSQCRDDHG